MTWVMAMSRSSTTLASTKSGLAGGLHGTTKSSMAAWGNRTSPRTRSSTTVVALVGRAEPQGPTRPSLEIPIPAPGRGSGPVVRPGVACACSVAGVDRLPGAVTGIEVPAVPQRVDGRLVSGRARRLPVRALVGGHAQPRRAAEDAVDPLLAVALGVGVLDAQDEGAAGAGGRTAS